MKKLDFITWIQRKGGIGVNTVSTDTKGLGFKESGFVGLVSKNGRGLDVLRDEAVWEEIIPGHMSTDEFAEMIRERVQAQSLGKAPNIPKTEAEISKLEEEWFKTEERRT